MKRHLPLILLTTAAINLNACKSKSHLLPQKRLTQEEQNQAANERIAKVEGFILATTSGNGQLDPGQHLEDTQIGKLTNGKATMTAMGSTLSGTCTINTEQKTKTDFISPNAVRFTVLKKSQNNLIQLEESKQNIPTTSSITGITLPLILLKNEWQLDEAKNTQPLTTKQKTDLHKLLVLKNLNSDLAIFGQTPRKIGDTWTATGIPDFLYGDLNSAKSTWNVTFTKIEIFQNTRCAVLEGPIELSGQSTNKDSQILYSGKLTIHRSLDQRINLQSTFTGKATVKLTMGQDSTLTLSGDFHTTQNSITK